MTVAVLAEKPSVARDLAQVLGARRRLPGALEGNGYVVTWAIGHLVRLPEPHQVHAEWKRWRRDDLPLLPERWPLQVEARTKDQYQAVRKVLLDPEIDEIVCATDAGREGELIFRYLYEKIGCRKPVRRLWISSLTPEAIRAGFDKLRPGAEMQPLADAARGRSRADWLVGMNLSRALSLANDETFSVGRVQTPTLAMIVERDRAIEAFVPEEYLQIVGEFDGAISSSGAAADGPGGDLSGKNQSGEKGKAQNATRFVASYIGSTGIGAAPTARPQPKRFVLGASDELGAPLDAEQAGSARSQAQRIVERARNGEARVLDVQRRDRKSPPPLLYDLTELQRHANRLWGFSAKHTLAIAQDLYERRKLITYPRTDSRHLSTDVAATLAAVVEAVRGPYQDKLSAATGERSPGRRFVDDRKVGDHHAILPTDRRADLDSLAADERRLYDLVCRRFLMMWQPHHELATVAVQIDVQPKAGGARTATDAGNGASSTVDTVDTVDAVSDRFLAKGTTVRKVGWKALELPRRSPAKGTAAGDQDEVQLPSLDQGQPVEVVDVCTETKRTQPPKPLNDATLLTAMETAGRTLDDRELSEAMKERGLGTPATRAEIIETLLRRGYVERQRKALHATERGHRLIDRVHPSAKSPAMTGEWEAKLRAVERNQLAGQLFLEEIERYVREVVGEILASKTQDPKTLDPKTTRPKTQGQKSAPARDRQRRREPDGNTAAPSPSRATGNGDSTSSSADASQHRLELGPDHDHDSGPDYTANRSFNQPPDDPTAAPGGHQPSRRDRPERVRARAGTEGSDLQRILDEVFHHDDFRPYQLEVCQALADGDDALLVMPTGAGKSLCYQLPGLARGGTTVVVSPLIALMEDQVQKLQELGLAAVCIHSARPREESRAACRRYLDGDLDFLFIAPERLSVPGFPELLAKRPPALVAIDEAHCISHWGHDFRPDYRLLGGRLPGLRPAPVMAATATATPRVQQDIIEQLGLAGCREFIHGFRRSNIAIEVVELRPSARGEATRRLLQAPERRPAIVYAPTRKEAERLAELLGHDMTTCAYHAGLPARRRERAQSDFIGGTTDVVVATIAFGMGVDKADVRTVVHTGLPSSLEGYYQEIGRAGRDGLPSRAVLYYSWADRRTHEYFHQRDYPAAEVLASLAQQLGEEFEMPEIVGQRARLDEEELESALDKLWIHGGAEIDQRQRVRRGGDRWRRPYEAQRQHKIDQLEEMTRFSGSHSCRMLHLVQHFGDASDSGEPCGICDLCRPEDSVARRYREPHPDDIEQMTTILSLLRQRPGGTGKLFTQAQERHGSLDRGSFEELLASLARADLLTVSQESFQKDGREIRFQRAELTRSGRRCSAEELAAVQLAEDAGEGLPSARKRKRTTTKKGARASGRGGRAAAAAEPKRSLDEAAVDNPLVQSLREWRNKEARRRRIPAFRVFPNRTLLAIAEAHPRSEDELLAVRGFGPALAQRYGDDLLTLCRAL